MKFGFIDDFFGVEQSSQNNRYILVKDIASLKKPTLLIVATKENREPIYRYKLHYPFTTSISNMGFAAAISFDYKKVSALITCINEQGKPFFTKVSNSMPSCLTFDNNSEYLVIAFCESVPNINPYRIDWLEVRSGELFKTQYSTNTKPIFGLSFDDKNDLIIKNS